MKSQQNRIELVTRPAPSQGNGNGPSTTQTKSTQAFFSETGKSKILNQNTISMKVAQKVVALIANYLPSKIIDSTSVSEIGPISARAVCPK